MVDIQALSGQTYGRNHEYQHIHLHRDPIRNTWFCKSTDQITQLILLPDRLRQSLGKCWQNPQAIISSFYSQCKWKILRNSVRLPDMSSAIKLVETSDNKRIQLVHCSQLSVWKSIIERIFVDNRLNCDCIVYETFLFQFLILFWGTILRKFLEVNFHQNPHVFVFLFL